MKESGTRTFDFSSGDVRLKTLLRVRLPRALFWYYL